MAVKDSPIEDSATGRYVVVPLNSATGVDFSTIDSVAKLDEGTAEGMIVISPEPNEVSVVTVST